MQKAEGSLTSCESVYQRDEMVRDEPRQGEAMILGQNKGNHCVTDSGLSARVGSFRAVASTSEHWPQLGCECLLSQIFGNEARDSFITLGNSVRSGAGVMQLYGFE
jgi:hypothetical protein